MSHAPLLTIRGLVKRFHTRRGLPGRREPVTVLRGVDLDIGRGETLGLVGESGCGKTTLARALLRLTEPDAGQVWLDGQPVTGADRRALRRLRPDMQMIFQDPHHSLDPRQTVEQVLEEALAAAPRRRERQRAAALLEQVELDSSLLARFPHELSGGQRQRVAIARALAPGPKLLVADEPVSALDVSVQAKILNLLMSLQDKLGLGLLFIGHDLAVVRRISHRVAVMYLGEIVETGPANRVLAEPAHPYTRALLESVPLPDPGRARHRLVLAGEVPSPAKPPAGCPFHPRCPSVMEVCRGTAPREIDLGSGAEPHRVRCHLHDGDHTPS